MIMWASISLVPLLLVGLVGCAVQTHPQPDIAAPPIWRTHLAGVAVAESQWWRTFDDPKLSTLIESAQLQNLDVAAAAQRVAQAQASLSIARGQQLPAADLGATVQKISGTTTSSASVGASYALDLWSEARARAFGARSQLEAAEAGHAVTLWRLASAVAQLYYQRRALDERLELARDGLMIAERTFGRVQARYDAGAISGLDLAQARTAVEAERSNVASVQLARDLAHNAMAVLLGRAPAELTEFELSSESLLDLAPPSLPQESPAEVLARRPDIRVLEAQLRAADANIAVARAQLFPQITIGADGTRLRGVDDVIFTSGANLIWAVFDGGQRRAGVRLAEAQYGELLENYRAGFSTH